MKDFLLQVLFTVLGQFLGAIVILSVVWYFELGDEVGEAMVQTLRWLAS